MWLDIVIWVIVFSIASAIGWGVYFLLRGIFRVIQRIINPYSALRITIPHQITQTKDPAVHNDVLIITSPSTVTEHKESIITPPSAKPAPDTAKESNIIDPNDPYNPLDITFDMIFEWEQVNDEECRLIFHRKPIVANVDFKCERQYGYKDARYYEYRQGEIIKPICIYGKRLEYYRDYSSFKDWRTKHIQVLLPEYMQGCIFKISDSLKQYGDRHIVDDECLLWVYAGERANFYRAEQSRLDEIAKEERRRIALEEEKAEIAAKIKEKYRRQQLEKLVRQELIDSGELFGEQNKRPQIPREVVDAVYRRDGGRCVYCGATENLHLDHIIPFSRGGATNVENLQLLCQKCNLTKSNKIG